VEVEPTSRVITLQVIAANAATAGDFTNAVRLRPGCVVAVLPYTRAGKVYEGCK
jgi:hypothetical protein